MTAVALIAIGGVLIFAALMLRAQPLPRVVAWAAGVAGIIVTAVGALRL